MRKIASTLLILLTLNLGIMQSSQATIAAFTGNPAIAIAGLGTIGGSYLVAHQTRDIGVFFIAFFVTPILGLVLLDGEDAQQIQFENIEDQKLFEMGLTDNEINAYRENLDELSLVANTISQELDKESPVEESVELWEGYGQLLDQDAYNAAQKIVNFAQ